MTATPAAVLPRHILTVVVEDYFQVGAFSHIIPSSYWNRFDTNLKRDIEATLALLEMTGNLATFFTCGWIADHHPEVLRRIADAGHEVACQGYFHHSISELPPRDFIVDARRSRLAVENATGQAVRGFRIGRGWIGAPDLWALDALAEAGFTYDSSFRAAAGDSARSVVHRHSAPAGELWEVPPSSLPLAGWPILLSGGNYVRQLPTWLMRSRVERWVSAHAEPLVFYFHTWEMTAKQPQITAAGRIQRLRHYRNLDAMPERTRHYLERYDFTSIASHLKLAPSANEPRLARVAAEAPRQVALSGSGMRRTSLSLVIPCFNEADTLRYLEKTLQRFAEKGSASFDLDCVLVDDGSTDDTWCLLQECFGREQGFTLCRHEQNRGIAAALITGFHQARGDFVAALDADCTFAPEQIFEMMAMMTEGVDVVVASPMHAQGAMRAVPAWRSLLSRGAAQLYRWVMRHKLTSYTSCFRLYRQQAVRDLVVYDTGFCGVTEILGRLDLAGCRIVEYPAVLEARLLGQSKIKILRTIVGHLRLALRLASLRWLGVPMPSPTVGESRVSYADNDRT